MLKTRSIVRHHVVRPWEVLGDGAVAVLALERALEMTETGARPVDGGGTLPHA